MSMAKQKPKRRGAAATETAPQKDAKTGRFLPGNSGFGGRPKGARSKLTTEFFEDFCAAWKEHGVKALKDVAEKSPKDFLRAAAMLMPKEFEIRSCRAAKCSPLDRVTAPKTARSASNSMSPRQMVSWFTASPPATTRSAAKKLCPQ